MTHPNGQTNVNRVTSFTGRQIRIRMRSVMARLARNVLVGELKDFLLITVTMIKMLPIIPSRKITLKTNTASRLTSL